jgi:hypothetical protein
MNEREHEILCKLLVDLFLESPRRRTQRSQQNSVQDRGEKASPDAGEIKDRQPGERKNGRPSKKAKKALHSRRTVQATN